MNPDRWQQVKAVCHAALERPPAERHAFLDEACAGDADLRREVESLLAQASDAREFLEAPPWLLTPDGVEPATRAEDESEGALSPTAPHGTHGSTVFYHGVAVTLAVGTLLGPYEVLEVLGSGGMGEVYRARDTRLGRTVAIKVLPPDLATDPERRRRFEQEARAVSALNHPHICTLYDLGAAQVPGTSEVSGRPDVSGGPDVAAGFSRPVSVSYLVMEYLEGQTLAERLRKGPLPLAQTLELGAQIADGLSATHKQGIVHRDLKPANIMLTKSGAKLLDFGLAKLRAHGERSVAAIGVPPTRSEPLTDRGIIVGTLPYMAPEQLEGKPADTRTDLWALGAILYEMLTGRRAFEEESSAKLVGAILEHDPEPVTAHQPLTPPAVDRLVRNCLAKAPDDRWQSAHDVAEELRWIGQTREGSGAPWTDQAQPIQKSHWSRLGAVAVAAVVVGAGVWTAWRLGLLHLLPANPVRPATMSIAVLPLENISGDERQEYFADGVTDSLINELAQIRSLRVISRTSVMRYKATRRPIKEIARELNGVDAIVEGTIIRLGNRVAVTVQLIDTSSDTHLWSRSYERDLTDILALRREIAGSVAQEIRAAISPEEERRLARRQAVNPAAYDSYLRGLELARQGRGGDSLPAALESLRRATSVDPGFAEAFATLSELSALTWWERFDRSPQRVREGRAAADRALELDAGLAAAHRAKGYARYIFDLDYAGALEEFSAALERNPSDSEALAYTGYVRRRQGRIQEALICMQNAVALNPLDVLLQESVGETYLLLRQSQAAERSFDVSLRLKPSYEFALMWKLRLHLRVTSDLVAAQSVERAAVTAGAGVVPMVLYQRVLLHMYAGDARGALERLAESGTDAFDLQFWFVPTAFLAAQVHDRLGRREEAQREYAEGLRIARARLALEPDDSRAQSAIGLAFAGLGEKAAAIRAGKAAVEILPVEKEAWGGAYRLEDLARIYAAVGERDAAVEILERLLAMPIDLAGPALTNDPAWQPLHGHPGFEHLVATAK